MFLICVYVTYVKETDGELVGVVFILQKKQARKDEVKRSVKDVREKMSL